MASYNETDPVPKDLDWDTPTEGATPPAEVNNAIREAKRVLKVESAIITTTGNLQLTEQHSTVLINGAHTITLPTIANVSSSTFTRRYRIINISASTGVLKTKAGGETLNGSDYSSTGLNLATQYAEYLIYGNGTVWYMEQALSADTISEMTAATGVTVDGVLNKDSKVTASGGVDAGTSPGVITDIIAEKTGAAGVTIDSFKIKDNAPDPTSWPSFSVHKNGTLQSTIGTPLEIITWSTEIFDTNSDFTSNRFTPTVAGKYLLTAQLSFFVWQNENALQIAIYKNGGLSNRTTLRTTGGNDQEVIITAIVDANGSGDYFEVYGANASATDGVDGTASRTFFMGSRIA